MFVELIELFFQSHQSIPNPFSILWLVSIIELFLTIALFGVAWLASWPVGWIVGIVIRFVFNPCIKRHEHKRIQQKDRFYKDKEFEKYKRGNLKALADHYMQRDKFSPLDWYDFSYNRVRAIQLIVSNGFLFTSFMIILSQFWNDIGYLLGLNVTILAVFLTRLETSEWIFSYLRRFEIFYYDLVRDGDIIEYNYVLPNLLTKALQVQIVTIDPVTTTLRVFNVKGNETFFKNDTNNIYKDMCVSNIKLHANMRV